MRRDAGTRQSEGLNFQEAELGTLEAELGTLEMFFSVLLQGLCFQLQSEVQSIGMVQGQKGSFLREQAGNGPMNKLLLTTASEAQGEDATVLEHRLKTTLGLAGVQKERWKTFSVGCCHLRWNKIKL